MSKKNYVLLMLNVLFFVVLYLSSNPPWQNNYVNMEVPESPVGSYKHGKFIEPLKIRGEDTAILKQYIGGAEILEDYRLILEIRQEIVSQYPNDTSTLKQLVSTSDLIISNADAWLAAASYRRLVPDSAMDSRTLCRLSEIYYRCKNYAIAIQYCDKALDIEPNHYHFIYQRWLLSAVMEADDQRQWWKKLKTERDNNLASYSPTVNQSKQSKQPPTTIYVSPIDNNKLGDTVFILAALYSDRADKLIGRSPWFIIRTWSFYDTTDKKVELSFAESRIIYDPKDQIDYSELTRKLSNSQPLDGYEFEVIRSSDSAIFSLTSHVKWHYFYNTAHMTRPDE